MKSIFIFLGLSLCFLCKTMAQPSLDHIALHVTSLEKSAGFYREIIQLDTIPEPFHDGKHAWFSIGSGIQLHIIEGAAKKSEWPKNVHNCFRYTSLDEIIGRLTKAGIDWEDAKGNPGAITTRPDGVHQVYFKDPDGYWIEANDAAGK